MSSDRVVLPEKGTSWESLEQRMRSLAAARPDETVYLRADRLLPYSEVLLVMDRIRGAGITRIGLVTNLLEPSEESP